MTDQWREKQVEAYFNKCAEANGALSLKFNSASARGVPDRILFLNGRSFLVEFKRPKGGQFSPGQSAMHSLLKSHGVNVYCLYNKSDVAAFFIYLQEVCGG